MLTHETSFLDLKTYDQYYQVRCVYINLVKRQKQCDITCFYLRGNFTALKTHFMLQFFFKYVVSLLLWVLNGDSSSYHNMPSFQASILKQ